MNDIKWNQTWPQNTEPNLFKHRIIQVLNELKIDNEYANKPTNGNNYPTNHFSIFFYINIYSLHNVTYDI